MPTPSLAEILASYGPIEQAPVSRLQSLTAKAMLRNWSAIPHVFHSDLLDVTALEDERQRRNRSREDGAKLTPAPFLLKAAAEVLKALPQFNASLDETGANLIRRLYVNLGLAIDTPKGLFVGVIRDCDRKSVDDIAEEARTLSTKARAKGLTLSEMSGACFTLSILGSLGGTNFTPIINAPEVAILGVSRLVDQPVRGEDGALVWRRALPVTLSYDHRALNGADAGRFMRALQSELNALAGTA